MKYYAEKVAAFHHFPRDTRFHCLPINHRWGQKIKKKKIELYTDLEELIKKEQKH